MYQESVGLWWQRATNDGLYWHCSRIPPQPHFWSPGIISSISEGPNQEGGGPKSAQHYNSPHQPDRATVFFPVVYFPYCTSSQQVFLPVFFLFPSFLFLPPNFFSFTKKTLIPINLPTLNTSLLVACCSWGSICTVPGGILCQRLTGDAAAAGSYYAQEKEGRWCRTKVVKEPCGSFLTLGGQVCRFLLRYCLPAWSCQLSPVLWHPSSSLASPSSAIPASSAVQSHLSGLMRCWCDFGTRLLHWQLYLSSRSPGTLPLLSLTRAPCWSCCAPMGSHGFFPVRLGEGRQQQ